MVGFFFTPWPWLMHIPHDVQWVKVCTASFGVHLNMQFVTCCAVGGEGMHSFFWGSFEYAVCYICVLIFNSMA